MPVPYLIATPAAEAIAFYTRVLGARELVRLTSPDAKIAHAELAIGDDKLMLADAYPEMGYPSPADLGGSPVSLYVRVADADAVQARAVAAGATERSPVADQFDGDRRGSIVDPFGHVWLIATEREVVSNAELLRRFARLAGAEEKTQ
jgi:PhnB protein